MSVKFTPIVLSLIFVGQLLVLLSSALGDGDCNQKIAWMDPCKPVKDCNGNGQDLGQHCSQWDWVVSPNGYFNCLGQPGCNTHCEFLATVPSYTWGNCEVVGSGCVDGSSNSEDCDNVSADSCPQGGY